MKKNWKLEVDRTAKLIRYESGYPNVVRPQAVEIKFDDITRILIRGNETFGYFLEFETLTYLKAVKEAKNSRDRMKIEKSQLGLWRDQKDAIDFAQKLSELVGKPVEETLEKNPSPSKEKLSE